MNNQAQLLTQSQKSQTRELVKHQLKVAAPAHTSPEIYHWVLQLWGIAPAFIDNPERLQGLLNEAVEGLRLTKVSDHTHYFGPGVSSVIILSESHLSVHTWPELGYMHVDIVTCVKKLTYTHLEKVFRRGFSPEYIQVAQLEY